MRTARLRVSRLLGAAMAFGLLVAGAVPAQAFTLIYTGSLSVSPTAGYPTASFKADGAINAARCPQNLLFVFYWDSTVYALGSTTLAAGAAPCDTGQLSFVPPSGDSGPGTHDVILAVLDPNTSQSFISNSPTVTYTVNKPPASPKPSPKPSPTPPASPKATPKTSPKSSPTSVTQASPSSKPSASPSACAVTGALPPPDRGGFVDTFIAGAMVASVLPLIGFALFGPAPLLAVLRRRRLLKLLGLAIVMAATLSCTSTSSPTANVSPVVSTSPVASPTC